MEGVIDSLKNFNLERNELLSLIFEIQHYQNHNLSLPISLSKKLHSLTQNGSTEIISFTLPSNRDNDSQLYYLRRDEAQLTNNPIPVYILNHKLALLEQVGVLELKNRELSFYNGQKFPF